MTTMAPFNQLWVIGRRSTRHYLRLYPNPGFMVTGFGRCFKWSRFYGWKVTRAPIRPS